MLTTFQKVGAAMLATTIVTALSPMSPAQAGETTRYKHHSCDGANAVCGVIVVGNAGSYTLEWTSLTARDDQPGGPATHPECPSVDKKIDDDVWSGSYNTFIVPASCAYKLKLKIKAANKKDQNLYLTPGCKIVTQVKGTTASNSWKGNDVEPLNDSVPTVNGKPVDAMGYKCGQQGSAGF
ncbi:MAG: hypothetical protein HRT80_06880 [Henriciella sp.]|nr:hypothetical protein [Henriciella sp.]